MVVQEVSGNEGGENRAVPTWTRNDLFWGLTALGSAIAAGSEKFSGLAQMFLAIYPAVITEIYITRAVMRNLQKGSERKQNINNGSEPIKKSGEQIILLGGESSVALEEIFKTNPDAMIPVFNSRNGAERLLDWFKSKTTKKDKQNPFYANLHLESGGTTAFDSPGLEIIQLSKENLVHTPNGDKLVVVSFGESFLPQVSPGRHKGISQDESQILFTRLVRKAIETGLINNPNEAIMIRLASMHDDSGKIKRDVGSNRTIRAQLEALKDSNWIHSGGIICVDAWTPIVREIQSITRLLGSSEEKIKALFFDTTSKIIRDLPWLEIFGLKFLGHVEAEDAIEKLKEVYKTDGNYDIVYFEDSDKATFARVNAVSEVEGIQIQDDKNINGVYVFETSQAARLAEAGGARKVVCAADLQEDLVLQILRMIKDGQTVDNVQEWLDEQLSERKITLSLNRAAELRLQERIKNRKRKNSD